MEVGAVKVFGRRGVFCGSACCLAAAGTARVRAAPVADSLGRFRLDFVGSFAATIGRGETAGRIRAEALPARGVWAVGPTEGLRGELTVVDGTAFVASLAHGRVRVVQDRSAAAPFLVWAEVARWHTMALPGTIADQRQLEAHLGMLAAQHGLDPDGPFPFLLTGAARHVEWHVLGGPAPGPAHGAGAGHGARRGPGHGAGHGAGQVDERRTLRRRAMTLVGFYSRRHEDVFTHAGEYSHIHFVSDDHALSGHVDALEPGPGLTLHLPG
jgi:acetolactate decarboxylase